jgi:hypothetical protein
MGPDRSPEPGGRSAEVLAGVDACRAGWVVALAGGTGSGGGAFDDVEVQVVATFAEVLGLGAATVAVDIPIGLPDAGPRVCDVAARRLLGPRRSSVFPAPVRAALDAHRRGWEATLARPGPPPARACPARRSTSSRRWRRSTTPSKPSTRARPPGWSRRTRSWPSPVWPGAAAPPEAGPRGAGPSRRPAAAGGPAGRRPPPVTSPRVRRRRPARRPRPARHRPPAARRRRRAARRRLDGPARPPHADRLVTRRHRQRSPERLSRPGRG